MLISLCIVPNRKFTFRFWTCGHWVLVSQGLETPEYNQFHVLVLSKKCNVLVAFLLFLWNISLEFMVLRVPG